MSPSLCLSLRISKIFTSCQHNFRNGEALADLPSIIFYIDPLDYWAMSVISHIFHFFLSILILNSESHCLSQNSSTRLLLTFYPLRCWMMRKLEVDTFLLPVTLIFWCIIQHRSELTINPSSFGFTFVVPNCLQSDFSSLFLNQGPVSWERRNLGDEKLLCRFFRDFHKQLYLIQCW